MTPKLSDYIQDGVLQNPDIQTVITTAHVEKQKITAMGGNSCEVNDIDGYVEKARSGVISATEAILKIQAVSEKKHGNGGHGLQG